MQPLIAQCTPATRKLLIRLKTFCDSVLLNYLSKLADSPAKRDHLWVAYTIEREYGPGFSLNCSSNFARLSGFLDFHAPDFPLALGWENFSKFLRLRQRHLLSDYLDQFLSNPGQSKEFYYDLGRWYAFVATLSLRRLRTR